MESQEKAVSYPEYMTPLLAKKKKKRRKKKNFSRNPKPKSRSGQFFYHFAVFRVLSKVLPNDIHSKNVMSFGLAKGIVLELVFGISCSGITRKGSVITWVYDTTINHTGRSPSLLTHLSLLFSEYSQRYSQMTDPQRMWWVLGWPRALSWNWYFGI